MSTVEKVLRTLCRTKNSSLLAKQDAPGARRETVASPPTPREPRRGPLVALSRLKLTERRQTRCKSTKVWYKLTFVANREQGRTETVVEGKEGGTFTWHQDPWRMWPGEEVAEIRDVWRVEAHNSLFVVGRDYMTWNETQVQEAGGSSRF